MAKGQRKASNPVEKLNGLSGQLENTIEAIIEAAARPEFAALMQEMKAKRAEEESKKTKLNKESREVIKLLRKYPGLSRSVLAGVKQKISEYKGLGVLVTYEKELPPVERKKKGSKAA